MNICFHKSTQQATLMGHFVRFLFQIWHIYFLMFLHYNIWEICHLLELQAFENPVETDEEPEINQADSSVKNRKRVPPETRDNYGATDEQARP